MIHAWQDMHGDVAVSGRAQGSCEHLRLIAGHPPAPEILNIMPAPLIINADGNDDARVLPLEDEIRAAFGLG